MMLFLFLMIFFLPNLLVNFFMFMILFSNFMSLYNLFLLLLLLVSFAIIMYSMYYMSVSVWFSYYNICLYSFIMVMSMLVLSLSGLMFIVFWDLLGVTSFLLVLFYLNWDSYTGSINTLMSNHFGDLFLILVMGVVILMQFVSSSLFVLLIIFLVLTSFTKSAQSIFLFWLPMAMSAPTPVSSLVHSSTLVTGGLFLLFTSFWELNNGFYLFLSIGTFFMSGFLSLFEKDLKKLVALSTLSQISLCVFVILMMYFMNSFSHMMTHAFFKSSLFMCVGVQIYNSLGSQESRFLKNLNFIHQMLFLISTLSLCGLLYLCGMCTKDMLLMVIFSSELMFLLYLLFFISVVMTFFYSSSLLKSLFSLSSVFLSVLSMSSIVLLPLVLVSGLMLFVLHISMSFIWIESLVVFMFVLFYLTFLNYYNSKSTIYKFVVNLPLNSMFLNRTLMVDMYSFSLIYLTLKMLTISKFYMSKYFAMSLMFMTFFLILLLLLM